MRLLLVVLVVVAVMLGGGTVGHLPPREKSYKILFLLMASPISHRNVFIPIAEALADRGHQVEVLSCLPEFSTTRNITQYNIGIDFLKDSNMFEILEQEVDIFDLIMRSIVPLVDVMYQSPVVLDLYERRKTFDIFLVDHICNELAYPFVYEMPFITVATPGMDPTQSAIMGNVLNPAFTPTLMGSIFTQWNVYDRLLNLLAHIHYPFIYYYWTYLPALQKEISEKFPEFPLLIDISRNQSLTLMNSHFTFSMSYPLLPSQVEVGALHCRPGKPLPQDLSSWIEGAGEAGVVYFSIGSVTKGDTMPTKYRELFIQAFSKLEQRVIWKYEGDLPGVSDNVLIKPWLPQQDILNDPGVKMFISHGGLLSTQEAIYHATPMLVLPIFADQPRNAENIASKGIGLYLNWHELSVDRIITTIQEIINNPKYKRNVQEISASLRDQITTPKERAVYWTEYVIRHGGAPHLKTPGANLSWVEYLMLDVLLLLFLAVIITFFVVKKMVLLIIKKIFTNIQAKDKLA
ncbi:UDP-glycosyltransferase UGT5 [Cherax quadricarinatus]|uniref:UDP-glycosyltransferase UGT5 n=1 Tax=Cherax quadricarinatus TaxID=27406 RepID=UPI0023795616|nr:UDP-glycosyltransferase UGT5-like [Cherax quadricarinatus]XP_053634293.1 UDP-glycosyltransferase UGT5-like [Cherax quadricarinatus]